MRGVSVPPSSASPAWLHMLHPTTRTGTTGASRGSVLQLCGHDRWQPVHHRCSHPRSSIPPDPTSPPSSLFPPFRSPHLELLQQRLAPRRVGHVSPERLIVSVDVELATERHEQLVPARRDRDDALLCHAKSAGGDGGAPARLQDRGSRGYESGFAAHGSGREVNINAKKQGEGQGAPLRLREADPAGECVFFRNKHNIWMLLRSPACPLEVGGVRGARRLAKVNGVARHELVGSCPLDWR